MKLSIVIPAYNEEKRIENTLISYYDYFNRIYSKDFEIFVVINGSNDNTIGVVDKISRQYEQIKYVNVSGKIGKGGAIIEGFKRVNGDLIGFVDADMATVPDAYYDLIVKLKNFDGIVASRWINGAIINRKQPLQRRVASRAFNLLIRILFGINIRDTQCGAKLFSNKAVKSVVNDLGITQWGFDVDLLYLLRKKDFKVIEIPTTWYDQEGSKLKVAKTSWQMFLSMIRLRLIYSRFIFVVKAYDKIHDNFFRK